jgi:hypothetical protein
MCHAAKEIHMQTLVRIVVAFVVVVLLLLVALPIQLIRLLAANEPKYEPGNESRPTDDLESEPESISPARAAATSASVETQPRIRREAINTR